MCLEEKQGRKKRFKKLYIPTSSDVEDRLLKGFGSDLGMASGVVASTDARAAT